MSDFKEMNPEALTENAFHLIGKDWMLVTAKNNDSVNTMTASWGGMGVMWGRNVAYVVIRPQRYTKEFIDFSDTFSLTFFKNEYRKELSYLGRVSGRDEDKISNSGLTLDYANDTPYFKEGKLVMICKKLYAKEMEEGSFFDQEILNKWYPNNDLHTMYIAEITQVLKK